LKDGEAESYHNVEVTYIPGRKAVLTIFDDGEETEKIVLSDYQTKEEMHSMMLEKGFTLKSEEEIAALKATKEAEKKAEADERIRKSIERQKMRRKQEAARKEEKEAARKEAEEARAREALLSEEERAALKAERKAEEEKKIREIQEINEKRRQIRELQKAAKEKAQKVGEEL